jgi:hypothetical protein
MQCRLKLNSSFSLTFGKSGAKVIGIPVGFKF